MTPGYISEPMAAIGSPQKLVATLDAVSKDAASLSSMRQPAVTLGPSLSPWRPVRVEGAGVFEPREINWTPASRPPTWHESATPRLRTTRKTSSAIRSGIRAPAKLSARL